MKNTCSLLAVAALATTLSAQSQLLLPDNHHLSEGIAKTAGSLNWWGTTLAGRHFQVLYDASHFTNAGVTSGITINALAFRGEDCETNKGGQTYSGIVVNVYSTALTSAAVLSTTFATNLVGATLLGTTAIPSMVVLPSAGTAPGTYAFNLPLGPMAAFDPTSAQPNLLVDILWTAYAPTPGTAPIPVTNTIATQDTLGTPAQIRGRGLYAASAVLLTGTGSAIPPVMRVTHGGPGGYASLIPASINSIGGACGGSPSGFYQLHRHTEEFDLKNPGQIDGLLGLTLTPNVYPAPAFYTVTGGAAAVDLVGGVTGVANSTGDDATYAHALPGPFDYPGGTTGTVRPSTNGYIILDPVSTETAGDYSCQLEEWLGSVLTNNYARLAPVWHDWHAGRNAVSNPGSGLYSRNVGSVCLVTWFQVGSFDTTIGDNEKQTFQCSIDTATGVIQFRYGTMSEVGGDTLDDLLPGGDYISCITGFTRGRLGGIPSVDPQSRDLSIERPFSTKVEGATSNMGLTAVSTVPAAPAHYAGRMHGGQSVTWNANNVPAGSLLGVLLLDGAKSQPGFQLPTITAPGCMLSTSLGASLYEVTLFPAATVTGVLPLLVPGGYNPGLLGAEIVAQYIILDGIFGGPDLVTVASNGLLHTVGLQ